LRVNQTVQTEFKNEVQKRIKKQIKLVNKNASEEELNRLCNDPEAAAKMIQAQIIGEKVHSKVANTVTDIQKKLEAIMALEESVNHLFELFTELS
jgi:syntaxin 1B/2/3